VIVALYFTCRLPIINLGITPKQSAHPESPPWLRSLSAVPSQWKGDSVYPGASARVTEYLIEANVTPPPVEGPTRITVEELSFGFPFRALTYANVSVQPRYISNPTISAIDAANSAPFLQAVGMRKPLDLDRLTGNKNYGAPWFIPVYPVWHGFLADSFLYAAIIALSVYWFTAIRTVFLHRFRRVRSRCEACAYDIEGLNQCPECGRKVGAKQFARDAGTTVQPS